MEAIKSYQQEILNELTDLPEEAMPNLIQIIRLFKESLLCHHKKNIKSLQEELVLWDNLSDEALIEFEKGL